MQSDSAVITISEEEIMDADMTLKGRQWVQIVSAARQCQDAVRAMRKSVIALENRLQKRDEDIDHLQRVVLDQSEIMQGLTERVEALEQRSNSRSANDAHGVVPMVSRIGRE